MAVGRGKADAAVAVDELIESVIAAKSEERAEALAGQPMRLGPEVASPFPNEAVELTSFADNNIGTASSKANLWPQVGGPLLTLGTAVAIELSSRMGLTIPNPMLFHALVLMYVAFIGGLRPALISTVIALLYAAYFFSIPGELFHYTTDNFLRVLVNIATLPSMALMVAILRGRVQRQARQLREINNKLIEISRKDSLTSLVNRRVIVQIAKAEFAKWHRYSRPFSLLLIDVDDLKSLNDRYGHLNGDDSLMLIANIINHSVRAVDIVGRYGGDEFVVVLPETDMDGALATGQNIIQNVRKAHLQIDDRPIQMTVSIGVATCGRDDKNLRSLLCRADSALYAAKKQGKGRIAKSAIPSPSIFL